MFKEKPGFVDPNQLDLFENNNNEPLKPEPEIYNLEDDEDDDPEERMINESLTRNEWDIDPTEEHQSKKFFSFQDYKPSDKPKAPDIKQLRNIGGEKSKDLREENPGEEFYTRFSKFAGNSRPNSKKIKAK